MPKEIGGLEDTETWVTETLPPDKKPLSCKWVYIIEFHASRKIERLKPRLVIFGNHQVDGITIFSPLAKVVTIRAFLEVATTKSSWELQQMDVLSIFLQRDLHEKVCMKLSHGFMVDRLDIVCHLKKSYTHYFLFTRDQGPLQVNFLVYIDDLVIYGNDSFATAPFEKYLGECHHMKDLGSLRWLGVWRGFIDAKGNRLLILL